MDSSHLEGVAGHLGAQHHVSGPSSQRPLSPTVTAMFAEMKRSSPSPSPEGTPPPFALRDPEVREGLKQSHSLLECGRQELTHGMLDGFLPDDTLHLVGHIFADSFVRDTEIEGLRHSVTAEFLTSLLDGLKGLSEMPEGWSEIMESCMVTARQVQTTATEMDKLAHGYNGQPSYVKAPVIRCLAVDIATRVREVPIGGTYTMSGGWRGAPGHAIVYEFKKNSDGLYDINVYNTGRGVGSYHDLLYVDNKKKIRPILSFSGMVQK